MVRLTITPAILQALKRVERHALLSGSNNDPPVDEPAIGNPISHAQILAISKSLKQVNEESRKEGAEGTPSYRLDDLLRESQIYIEPPKPKTEPTSEYKALMARLRREEEDRAYERMINPPLPTETFSQRFPTSSHAGIFPERQQDIGDDDEITYADVNRQIALIINIMISIVACSVALWLAARHWNTPSRLGLSMGGSGAVAIAEAVVYAGYLRRLKEAREKGKKEVEIKEIIKTWVIGDDKEPNQKDAVIIRSKESEDRNFRRRKITRN